MTEFERRIAYEKRRGVAAMLAVLCFTTPSAAAELPLSDVYGSLIGCLAHNGDDSSATDRSMILTKASFAEHEGSCEFDKTKTTAIADSPLMKSWSVEARCASEGIETHKTFLVTEFPRLLAVIGSPDEFPAATVLPACSLPYEVQVRVENERLNDGKAMP